MSALVTLLLASCQWFAPSLPPAPPEQPVSSFHELGGGQIIRLADHLDEAEISLPASNRPVGTEDLGVFELREGWKKAPKKMAADWMIAAPMDLPDGRQTTPPAGLVMMRGEEQLKYRCPPRSLPDRWCTHGDRILVSAEASPAELQPPLLLLAKEAVARLKRLDFASAGLSEQDYLRYEHSIHRGKERITRPGLLFPGGASLSWTLTLPPGARLDLAATMVHLGLELPTMSDGARLVVEVNGEAIGAELIRSAERFDLHRFDLSPWEGQEVTLTLRCDPLSTADWDYMFLGEPMISGDPPRGPRRVVVIGLDTTRWASFTQTGHERDTTSALDPLAESSALFDHAYTPAPRTRPSFRTAVTGRRPFAAMDAPTTGEVFREHGFMTAGVTANVHLVPRFGFNDGFDLWQFENSVDADVEINRAKSWLRTVEDRDALLFVHFMDAHNFYKAPLFYENKFVTADPGPLEWDQNRWKINSLIRRLSDENKLWLEERYDGEVNYMTDQLAEFVAWLASLPGETLIVIHSDHGEEFFEHDGYEHNHTLYQEVTHAVLWVRPPGGWGEGPHHLEDPVGLMDIAPTLYDFAGIPQEDWPELDGVSLRPLLDAGQAAQAPALRRQLADRPLPMGHIMYDKERWGVVAEGHKYILQTMSGEEELYDLRADPEEQQDLAPDADRAALDHFLARLSEATGWPAGPGLRVEVFGGDDPFTLRFDAPVVDARVIDPDAEDSRRPNLEWGEPSPIGPAEVGAIEVSEDRLSVTFTPGSHGKGTFGVVTGRWGAGGQLEVGEEVLRLDVADGLVKLGDVRVKFESGAVILPLDSVRQRLENQAEQAHDEEALEMLRELGYVGDGDEG